MADEQLPEQIYRLGERIEFLDLHREIWLEGIICNSVLMGDETITYGCVADNGFSLARLECERVRPINVVVKLGRVANAQDR